jgi:hypothetical protein
MEAAFAVGDRVRLGTGPRAGQVGTVVAVVREHPVIQAVVYQVQLDADSTVRPYFKEDLERVRVLKPQRLHCFDCGAEFTWGVEEQEFYKRQGYDRPEQCSPCRQAQRERAGLSGDKGA